MSRRVEQTRTKTDSGAGNVYWHDGIAALTPTITSPLNKVDVVVIGAGYTGMHAAIAAARAGRMTQIIDMHELGWGCSTRNGGQISPSIKPTLAALTRRYGADRARAIRNEGYRSLEWVGSFIKTEELNCDYQRCGRFHAAHTPAHFDALVRDAERLGREEDVPFEVVSRDGQHAELGTSAYFGGIVMKQHASLDPAKYYSGLLDLAKKTGVAVTDDCPALDIRREGSAFVVTTPKGDIRAEKVVIATNGYTTSLVPWLQRRVIPIGTYMIATDPLPKALMDKLFPKDRVASDTCKVIYYYRPSPDRSRILFGGRVSADETNPAISGPKLHHDMCRIFPELADYGYTHSWTGTVAFTFDTLAHLGQHAGLHYAMGYCGSGIGMASYLGMRLGQQLVDDPDGATAFDNLRFPTRPLYFGKPWFLPSVVRWYRFRDHWQIRRAAANARLMS
jgi:glycine/D-amino acid oxidase-like deaminating enzyme